MDKAKIIENNIIDLKIGLELAEIAENDFLKIIVRIEFYHLMKVMNIYLNLILLKHTQLI